MKKLGLLLLLAAALPLCGFKFLSQLENEKANKLYKKGQIGKAKNVYAQALKKDPSSPQISYNLGNAFFREGAFKESQATYEKSTASKDEQDRLLRSKAFYNLGNSFYRQKDLPNAAEGYKNALRIDPKDQDAKYNLELVLKQMEKDNKDQKKDEKDKDQKKQDQKKDQQDQNKDQQNNQGGSGQEQKDPQDQKQDQGGQGEGGGTEQQQPQSGKDESESSGGQKEESQGQEEKAEQGKGEKGEEKEQPKSEAQMRAEQLLGALENQEQQVLKFQNSQQGPRGRVRRVAEQDW